MPLGRLAFRLSEIRGHEAYSAHIATRPAMTNGVLGDRSRRRKLLITVRMTHAAAHEKVGGLVSQNILGSFPPSLSHPTTQPDTRNQGVTPTRSFVVQAADPRGRLE